MARMLLHMIKHPINFQAGGIMNVKKLAIGSLAVLASMSNLAMAQVVPLGPAVGLPIETVGGVSTLLTVTTACLLAGICIVRHKRSRNR